MGRCFLMQHLNRDFLIRLIYCDFLYFLFVPYGLLFIFIFYLYECGQLFHISLDFGLVYNVVY